MNVLLVGPWVAASLAFARSLRQHGVGTYLLQTNTAQYCSPQTFSAIDGHITMPPGVLGTEEGIDFIRQYVERVRASALAALTDRELLWLARNREEFGRSCQLLVQPHESLSAILSKHRQIEIARQSGLLVLPTYRLTRPEDADTVATADWPLIVRPDQADSVEPRFKVRFIDSRESLRTLMRQCQRLEAPLVGQPFLPLPNLVVHGARSISGNVIASRCYDVPRTFEGLSLAVQPRSFPAHLEDRCRMFVINADIQGSYHFEFLFSAADSLAYFLEVNVRLGGTTDKVVRTGFDEPALLLQSFGILARHASAGTASSRRVVNKRVMLKHIMRAGSGRLRVPDYPETNRLAHVAYSCRDLFLAKDSIFDWHDVSGSLRFHLRDVITACRARKA
jgi:predicted ATP-grasp superfamily ATP-dependent carboligase